LCYMEEAALPETVVRSVRASADWWARVVEVAKREDEAVNALIVRAVDEWLGGRRGLGRAPAPRPEPPKPPDRTEAAREIAERGLARAKTTVVGARRPADRITHPTDHPLPVDMAETSKLLEGVQVGPTPPKFGSRLKAERATKR